MLTQVTVQVCGITHDVAIIIDENQRVTVRALRSPAGGRWIPLLPRGPLSPCGMIRLTIAARGEALRRMLFAKATEYHAALAEEDAAERAAHPERFISGAAPAQKEE